jgi:hypothetical protein
MRIDITKHPKMTFFFPTIHVQIRYTPCPKNINSIRSCIIMKAALILALIVAVCTCSASDSEVRKLLEGEGKNSKLSCYAKDKINTSTPDQRSQTDEERYYDESMKGKLEGIRKRVEEERSNPDVESLLQKLGQEESRFTSEDKALCMSFFREVFNQKKDASENLLKQIYSKARESYWPFENCYFVSQGVKDVFFIMDTLAFELGWEAII